MFFIPDLQPMGQADQDRFLRMMSHAQHGRMDEQRCVLNPSSRSSPSTAPTGRPFWCSGLGFTLLGCYVFGRSFSLGLEDHMSPENTELVVFNMN